MLTELKQLTKIFGPTAYEGNIAEYIKGLTKDYVDSVESDVLGNVILFKKGIGDNKSKIMITCPMDQPGFIITHIESERKCKFSDLANQDIKNLSDIKVTINGKVPAIIKKEEGKKGLAISDYDINIEDDYKANLGDVAVLEGEYWESDDSIVSPHLMPRAGCFMLINIIRQLKDIKDDIYFVFSSHGMVGARGAQVAANSIRPDIGISIGIINKESQNVGPSIIMRDSVVVSNPYLIEEFEELAKQNSIKLNKILAKNYISDVTGILQSGCNTKVISLAIAVESWNIPDWKIRKEDIKNMQDLLIQFLLKK